MMAIANWCEINKSCHWQVCSVQRQVAFVMFYDHFVTLLRHYF